MRFNTNLRIECFESELKSYVIVSKNDVFKWILNIYKCDVFFI